MTEPRTDTMAQPLRRPTIDTIQALRFFAALIVVLDHARFSFVEGAQDDRARSIFPFFSGRFGVDIFFILSGFIMVYISSGGDRWRVLPHRFMLDRLIRIVPLYWLATLAYMILVVATAKGGLYPFSLEEVLKSFLFIPYQNLAYSNIQPVLAQGWTLNYEILFYVAFAFLLASSRKIFPYTITLIFVALAALGLAWNSISDGPMTIIGHGVQQHWVVPRFYLSPLILQFLAGAIIAMLFEAPSLSTWRLRGGFWTSLAACGAGIATMILVFNLVDRESVAMEIIEFDFAAIVVVGAIAFRAPFARDGASRLLVKFGNASYSLYLTHFHVLFLASWLWKHAAQGIVAPGVFALLAAAASCLVSLASYQLIERPVTARLHRWLVPIGNKRLAIPEPATG
jgi:exopolysaccharide production protein ExoZ